jgi:hypothetical protein
MRKSRLLKRASHNLLKEKIFGSGREEGKVHPFAYAQKKRLIRKEAANPEMAR